MDLKEELIKEIKDDKRDVEYYLVITNEYTMSHGSKQDFINLITCAMANGVEKGICTEKDLDNMVSVAKGYLKYSKGKDTKDTLEKLIEKMLGDE